MLPILDGRRKLEEPYALHPAHYTLRPTPYTLHPAPYTLHPTPYTLHLTPYTLHTHPDLFKNATNPAPSTAGSECGGVARRTSALDLTFRGALKTAGFQGRFVRLPNMTNDDSLFIQESPPRLLTDQRLTTQEVSWWSTFLDE